MIVGIVSPPFSGAKQLGREIARTMGFVAIRSEVAYDVLQSSQSENLVAARELIAAGCLPPETAMAEAWWEATKPHTQAVLIGFLPTVGGVLAYERLSAQPVLVVHHHAPLPVLDANRAACGIPPIEDSNPGVFERFNRRLLPLLDNRAQVDLLIESTVDTPLPLLVREMTSRLKARGQP